MLGMGPDSKDKIHVYVIFTFHLQPKQSFHQLCAGSKAAGCRVLYLGWHGRTQMVLDFGAFGVSKGQNKNVQLVS